MARLKNWNPPKISQSTAIYRWSAPHAAEVFYGKRTRGTGAEIPGRDWLSVALRLIDLQEAFLSHFSSINAISAAFRATAEDFDKTLTAAIEGDYYAWPRRTRRRNRTVVTSPRNIVDLGQLRDSQSMQIEERR